MWMQVVLAVLCLAAAHGARILNMDSPDRIPGQYIVVLNPVQGARANKLQYVDHTIAKIQAISENTNAMPRKFAIADFIGFEMHADDVMLNSVANMPEVKYIEANMRVEMEQNCVEEDASQYWGLQRVSHRDLPTDPTYIYNSNIADDEVKLYIIDTGIRISHVEFPSGKAVHGFTAFNPGDYDDENGHGTHCAGTAGGNTAGVARQPQIEIVNVKVLGAGGGGTTAGIIAGVDYCADQGPPNKSVASMSLGSGPNQAMDDACDAASAAGVTVLTSAGNGNIDTCQRSPARAPTVISVGSTQSDDARSSFSNWGTCNDVFAPGSAILSSHHTSDTAYATLSGTSMACPHVAGAIARRMAEVGSMTPAQSRDWVRNHATPDKIPNPNGSPNLLLYAGCELPQ